MSHKNRKFAADRLQAKQFWLGRLQPIWLDRSYASKHWLGRLWQIWIDGLQTKQFWLGRLRVGWLDRPPRTCQDRIWLGRFGVIAMTDHATAVKCLVGWSVVRLLGVITRLAWLGRLVG